MTETDWLDELIGYCTKETEEIPMPEIIPETCSVCGRLADECVCQEWDNG